MSVDISIEERDGIIYNADSCEPLEAAWIKEEIEMQALARGNYPGRRLLKNDLSGMKSIGYWNARTKQNWGLDYHRNEGIEICLLESGTLDFDLNNKTYKLIPNTLTITRPWIRHKLGSPEITPSKLHWFILDVDVTQPHQVWKWPDWIVLNANDLAKLTDILRRNEQPVWQVGNSIKEGFVEIGNRIKANDSRYLDTRIKILINQILIQLLELFTLEKPELNDDLIQSKRSVELFLGNLVSMLDEEWTLLKMAEYCGLGTTQFSKYTLEITNASPMNYLNNLRISQAKDLLEHASEKSITDIAFECGFSSIQYFSQVFRKHYKRSPKAFRAGVVK